MAFISNYVFLHKNCTYNDNNQEIKINNSLKDKTSYECLLKLNKENWTLEAQFILVNILLIKA